ncbi:MAG: hypothetical protein ACI9BW_004723 [Gammaproteobacteria bacterium]|jgi:hypothetical protein
MSIEFHDPRAQALKASEPYVPRASLSGEIVVGLLANGFPDSDTFLEAMESSLKEHLPNASFKHYNKRNASIRVSDAMLNDISSECGVAIAAYGH